MNKIIGKNVQDTRDSDDFIIREKYFRDLNFRKKNINNRNDIFIYTYK